MATSCQALSNYSTSSETDGEAWVLDDPHKAKRRRRRRRRR
jgi:hypothetical protein